MSDEKQTEKQTLNPWPTLSAIATELAAVASGAEGRQVRCDADYLLNSLTACRVAFGEPPATEGPEKVARELFGALEKLAREHWLEARYSTQLATDLTEQLTATTIPHGPPAEGAAPPPHPPPTPAPSPELLASPPGR